VPPFFCCLGRPADYRALKLGPVDYVLPLEGIAGLVRSLPIINAR
jgi:hypothetical protein